MDDQRDPFAGWTFAETPEGFYLKAANGWERFYTNAEAAEWAVSAIVDASLGRIGADYNLQIVQRVIGPERFAEAAKAAEIVGHAYADEVERIAAAGSRA